MADAGKPPATSETDSNVNDVEIPTVLPSDVGMDYVPLATMLATGQLAEADQVSLFVLVCGSVLFCCLGFVSCCAFVSKYHKFERHTNVFHLVLAYPRHYAHTHSLFLSTLYSSHAMPSSS